MPFIAINSESAIILWYKNKVADISESGKITSKKRGSARLVRTQNVYPADSELMTISKNFRDCVKKMMNVKTTAMNAVAIVRLFKR